MPDTSMVPYFERQIVFNGDFIRLGIGINGALFLSQALYWTRETSDKDGWFYKTKEDIEEETTLTRYQQDRVRKHLEKLEVLEVKNIMAGGAPTLHYRVNVAQVVALLEKQQHNNKVNE